MSARFILCAAAALAVHATSPVTPTCSGVKLEFVDRDRYFALLKSDLINALPVPLPVDESGNMILSKKQKTNYQAYVVRARQH